MTQSGRKYFSLISWIIFSISALSTNAQEYLKLEHADFVKGENRPSQGMVVIANGNVYFRQGNVEMFCQRVTWFKDQHKTIFEQDVKFDDGHKVLHANKVFYNDQARIERAIGQVVFIDSLHKLTANMAVYDENKEKIMADNHVVITDNENEVVLTGQHAEYWRNKKYAVVTGNPVLIKTDSTGLEEIRVTGKKMELYEGGQRTIVNDSVKITHINGRAYCNKAEYFKSDNRVLLQQQPIVWQKHDRLSGKEIELYFKDRELSKVIITDHALVTSPTDTAEIESRINKLSGDKITLSIENKALKDVLVEGKATSYYHIFENENYKGLNKIIGDKIMMYLSKGEIIRIIVESEPGISSGIFYPPGLEKSDL